MEVSPAMKCKIHIQCTCMYVIHVQYHTVTHTVHNLYKSWVDNLSATFVYKMTTFVTKFAKRGHFP